MVITSRARLLVVCAMLSLPPVGAGNWALGIGLMVLIGLVVGVLPALRAMRLNIVDALAGR